MVLLVVFQLLGPSAHGLVDGLLHAVSNRIRIHYHLSVDISRSASGRLSEAPMAAQEALLVGIKNGDERHFRQVKPLAEKIHSYQDVVEACAEVVDDSHTVKTGDEIGRASCRERV